QWPQHRRRQGDAPRGRRGARVRVHIARGCDPRRSGMTSPGLVRIHRYVALSLGALVVLMGLTGAALVFRAELTAVFTPAVKVSSQPVPPGEYQRILAAARRVEPGARSLDIVPSGRPERAAEVILYRAGPERHLFV